MSDFSDALVSLTLAVISVLLSWKSLKPRSASLMVVIAGVDRKRILFVSFDRNLPPFEEVRE